MGTVTLPKLNQTGGNEWADVEDNDRALRDEINGNLDNTNLKSSAAIAHSKLASGSAAQLMLFNGSGVPTATTVTGDVTISSSGVTAIGAGVIVNAGVSSSAGITPTKLARGTLHNDGSASTTFTASNTYTVTGATFTADVTGLHIIVSSGTVTVADVNDTDYYQVVSKLFVDGVGFGVELGGVIAGGNAGVGAIPGYLPFVHAELASLTSGQVVTHQIKNSNISDGSVTCGVNDFVIKATCLKA